MKKNTYTLYLVRHAIAEERGDKWPDDSTRPLTSKGAARFRKVVRGLRELGVTVDLVLTSPLVRAKQTAQLLVEGLRPAPALAVTPALAPGVGPAKAAEALGQFRKARRIALVGHEPDLGELAAWLIGTRAPVAFKKGGVCRIDGAGLPPADGQLIWLAPPRVLRKIV